MDIRCLITVAQMLAAAALGVADIRQALPTWRVIALDATSPRTGSVTSGQRPRQCVPAYYRWTYTQLRHFAGRVRVLAATRQGLNSRSGRAP